MLIYAELPDRVDSNTQDRLEELHRGRMVECPRCRQQTRVYEGLTVLIR